MSTKEDIFSVGPSQPEMIGFPTGSRFVDFCERVGNRNSRRAGGLSKPFFSHVIDVFVAQTTTVIMNKSNKIQEAEVQLKDREHYKPLEAPMVNTTQTKVNQIIDKLYRGKHKGKERIHPRHQNSLQADGNLSIYTFYLVPPSGGKKRLYQRRSNKTA